MIQTSPFIDELTESQREEFLWHTCDTFHDGQTYADYCDDICRYLMLCSWHYSRETALKTIEAAKALVRQTYDAQEPVADIAVDIGYSCG